MVEEETHLKGSWHQTVFSVLFPPMARGSLRLDSSVRLRVLLSLPTASLFPSSSSWPAHLPGRGPASWPSTFLKQATKAKGVSRGGGGGACPTPLILLFCLCGVFTDNESV